MLIRKHAPRAADRSLAMVVLLRSGRIMSSAIPHAKAVPNATHDAVPMIKLSRVSFLFTSTNKPGYVFVMPILFECHAPREAVVAINAAATPRALTATTLRGVLVLRGRCPHRQMHAAATKTASATKKKTFAIVYPDSGEVKSKYEVKISDVDPSAPRSTSAFGIAFTAT